MTEKEMMQKNIEEFSRLQDYMVDSERSEERRVGKECM